MTTTKFVSASTFRELARAGTAGNCGVLGAARALYGSDDEGSRRRRFVLSDGSVDRISDTIAVNGWKLDNYRENPVVGWSHDMSIPPIGRMHHVAVENGKLVGEVEFAPPTANEFAETVFQLVKGGFLRAGSVGFLPLEWQFSKDRPGGIDYKRQELLEFSITPIPANANALVEARAKGINISDAHARLLTPPSAQIRTMTLGEVKAERARLAVLRAKFQRARR